MWFIRDKNWPPVPLNECLRLFERNTEFQTVSPLVRRLFEGPEKRCTVKSYVPERSTWEDEDEGPMIGCVFFPTAWAGGAFIGSSEFNGIQVVMGKLYQVISFQKSSH